MQSVVSRRRGWVAHALLAVACLLAVADICNGITARFESEFTMSITLPRPSADAVRISGMFLATHQADLFTGTTQYATDATSPCVRKDDRSHMGGKERARWSPITRVEYSRSVLRNAHKTVALLEANLPADCEREHQIDMFVEVASIVALGRAIPDTVPTAIGALDVDALRKVYLVLKRAKANAALSAKARKDAAAQSESSESSESESSKSSESKSSESESSESKSSESSAESTVTVTVASVPTVDDVLAAINGLGPVSLADKLALASAVSALHLADATPATAAVGS